MNSEGRTVKLEGVHPYLFNIAFSLVVCTMVNFLDPQSNDPFGRKVS